LRSIEEYLLKNTKFIVFSLVILLGIATTLVFAIAWLNPVSLGPNGMHRGPMEEISTNWGSYDSQENAIFVNCTLTKGYNGATECNLTKFTLDNYKGRVFEGIPVPTKLLLNETTTVKLNLGSHLSSEIYYGDIATAKGSHFRSPELNFGNFVDPQEQIEVKEIFYDKTTNTLFVECNRIYARTDLSATIKDNRSAMISLDNYDRPVRIDIPPNATELRISPQKPLTPGQYCLYLIASKCLITQFTVP
jgi:hypothetical protein